MSLLEYGDDDDFSCDEVLAEEATIVDVVLASGYSHEWIQEEILVTMAQMGLYVLEQNGSQGGQARVAKFTVDVGEDMPVEISVRLQDERKKKRLH